MLIRRARPDEAGALAALAVRSKGHWQDGPAELARFARTQGLTAAVVEANEAWVGEHAGAVVGFHTVLLRGPLAVLDDLWLEPSMIGRGFGRQLYEHAVETAAAAGATLLEWDAEPGAVGFYLHMGAVPVRYGPSPRGAARPRMQVAVGSSVRVGGGSSG